jgi:hypothetical protein
MSGQPVTIRKAPRQKHGGFGTRLYNIWVGVKSRCDCPTVTGYYLYGARGIAVCSEWYIFESFRIWSLANGYRDDLTLDRIDVNGNYEPGNCCWATRKEQSRNRRNNVLITAFGETKCRSAWVEDERCAVGVPTLQHRINRGMNPEEAILTPPQCRNQYTKKRRRKVCDPKPTALEI